MRTAAAAGLAMAIASAMTACADDGDDTLRFFLSKSELVVLGEIASEPAGISLADGAVNYICDFRIAKVLKGDQPEAGTIRVGIVRFEIHEDDRLPELKKGGRCILFLKNAGDGTRPAWRTADVWFGWQRPSPGMARSLERLVEQDKQAAR